MTKLLPLTGQAPRSDRNGAFGKLWQFCVNCQRATIHIYQDTFLTRGQWQRVGENTPLETLRPHNRLGAKTITFRKSEVGFVMTILMTLRHNLKSDCCTSRMFKGSRDYCWLLNWHEILAKSITKTRVSESSSWPMFRLSIFKPPENCNSSPKLYPKTKPR